MQVNTVIKNSLFSNTSKQQIMDSKPTSKFTVVGGGILGLLTVYFAWKKSLIEGKLKRYVIYEKNNDPSMTTTSNIVPSLTSDESVGVIPRGGELVKSMAVAFNEKNGCRVEDVPGINDSPFTERFKNAVINNLNDDRYDKNKQALLSLGKRSMELWHEMYEEADDDLKEIFDLSRYRKCGEFTGREHKQLDQGYRIDIIFDMDNASAYSQGMIETYKRYGYQQSCLLTPDKVVEINPALSEFCSVYSCNNDWNNGVAAVWRPGGSLDTATFIPLFKKYLQDHCGSYFNKNRLEKRCFKYSLNSEVTGINVDPKTFQATGLTITRNGQQIKKSTKNYTSSAYVIAPGCSVGTLHKFNFMEPPCAGFAGPSLVLMVPLKHVSNELQKSLGNGYCMEVHKEGIVLAWQASIVRNNVIIGVGGTKAYYGDQKPHNTHSFAMDRHVVQLNIINEVHPDIVSAALGFYTKGKQLNMAHVNKLIEKGWAKRWVGIRSVAFDGLPSVGPAILAGSQKMAGNVTVLTHASSAGVSNGPALAQSVVNRKFNPLFLSDRGEHIKSLKCSTLKT